MKKWLSNFDTCDVCHKPIKDHVDFFVDGQIKGSSAWGLMCPTCFEKYGAGIGYGVGQKYNGHTAELLEGGYVKTEMENEMEGYEP